MLPQSGSSPPPTPKSPHGWGQTPKVIPYRDFVGYILGFYSDFVGLYRGYIGILYGYIWIIIGYMLE